MEQQRLLLLSSSRVGAESYLASGAKKIQQFLGEGARSVAFIPFAGVRIKPAEYLGNVQQALQNSSYRFQLAETRNAKKVLESADVIMIGGGNSFKLLHDLYAFELIDLIREKVRTGCPYIGWSAGANIAGPTIGTTNDMPIIEPKSMHALGFVPFQINPHYQNFTIAGFNGETRDQRLTEYLTLNPSRRIVALPEGTLIEVSGNATFLHGEGIRLFDGLNNSGEAIIREVQNGERLMSLQ